MLLWFKWLYHDVSNSHCHVYKDEIQNDKRLRFHKTVLLDTRLVHYFIQDLHNKIGKNPKLLSYGPEPWVGYIMRSLNIPA